MKINKQKVFASIVLVAVLVTTIPNVTLAQGATQYQPQTTKELIAYLMGRIAQLQEMQRTLQGGTGSRTNNTQSSFDFVTVYTQKADLVTDVTAVLRGEVLLFGKASAVAWFEYGQDEDFLDFKTNKVNVRSAYDRAIRTSIRNLEEDENYFVRLVAQDKNGTLIYGEIFQFRTDELDE